MECYGSQSLTVKFSLLPDCLFGSIYKRLDQQEQKVTKLLGKKCWPTKHEDFYYTKIRQKRLKEKKGNEQKKHKKNRNSNEIKWNLKNRIKLLVF